MSTLHTPQQSFVRYKEMQNFQGYQHILSHTTCLEVTLILKNLADDMKRTGFYHVVSPHSTEQSFVPIKGRIQISGIQSTRDRRRHINQCSSIFILDEHLYFCWNQMTLTNLISKTGRVGNCLSVYKKIVCRTYESLVIFINVLFKRHCLNFSSGSLLNRLHFMRNYRKLQPGDLVNMRPKTLTCCVWTSKLSLLD